MNTNAHLRQAVSCGMNWKFSPLFNEDGSTCYFRVCCLALAGVCALLHVFLKAMTAPEAAPDSGDLQLSAQSMAESAAVATVSEESSNSWSFFGEDKERRQLLKIRKMALTEINDSAAYLAACGNINAGYVGCKYTFSDQLNPYYDASIEAAADGFIITLQAKGEQLKDDCSKFVINSEGYYAGFNKQGHMDQKCLLEISPSSSVLALHRSIDDVQGNPAPSGAILASSRER